MAIYAGKVKLWVGQHTCLRHLAGFKGIEDMETLNDSALPLGTFEIEKKVRLWKHMYMIKLSFQTPVTYDGVSRRIKKGYIERIS